MAKGLSLHIGLNSVDPAHYAGWSGPLNACEADADDMDRVARAAGYGTHKLLTKKATRDAVIDQVKAAASELKAGDIFFLTYSGHGGQVPDIGGDETDLTDETWCLYDGQLIDDELLELWSRFAEGVRILVLSDSCHSGTVTRVTYNALAATGAVTMGIPRVDRDEETPAFRVMPDEVALRTFRQNKEFYRRIAPKVAAEAAADMETELPASVRLISGCQDNQLSMDGTFNGLFTGTLLQVWGDGAFRGSYRRFHRAIVTRMPPTQTPNHFVIGRPNRSYDAQRPFQI